MNIVSELWGRDVTKKACSSQRLLGNTSIMFALGIYVDTLCRIEHNGLMQLNLSRSPKLEHTEKIDAMQTCSSYAPTTHLHY